MKKLTMKRNIERSNFINSRFKEKFGPKIWVKIEENREVCYKLMVAWNGSIGFEVSEIDNPNNRFIINIQRSMCTCKRWDLIGIPYCHIVYVIMFKGWTVEDYVSKWYTSEYFEKIYEWCIEMFMVPNIGLTLG